MNILKHYNENIVKYDLINKFSHKTLGKIPKLKFITLNFKLKKCDVKSLVCSLAALQLITQQKGALTTSKISNISLKIRKGQPVGCKLTLRKSKLNRFLFQLVNKDFRQQVFDSQKLCNLFSIKLKNVLVFDELEQNYQFFNNLSNLNINIGTTDCTFDEFVFLLKSYKLSA